MPKIEKRNALGGLVVDRPRDTSTYPPDGVSNLSTCFSLLCERREVEWRIRCGKCHYRDVAPFFYVYAGPWVEWAKKRLKGE